LASVKIIHWTKGRSNTVHRTYISLLSKINKPMVKQDTCIYMGS